MTAGNRQGGSAAARVSSRVFGFVLQSPWILIGPNKQSLGAWASFRFSVFHSSTVAALRLRTGFRVATNLYWKLLPCKREACTYNVVSSSLFRRSAAFITHRMTISRTDQQTSHDDQQSGSAKLRSSLVSWLYSWLCDFRRASMSSRHV